ncbi:neutral zinc metallopeptidase [Amycolatopsis sp. H20-H5]|uniref:neutral zinc metallopeptidase n=1 Tax=Amycolatopsis sp. H20-H5 TaxID=3046309 RepID=UPI003FA3A8D3
MTQPPHGQWPPRGAVQPPPVPGRPPAGPWQGQPAPWQGQPHQFPAPPRKSAGAIVGICLGAVAVLVLGLVAIVALNHNDNTPVANANYAPPAPTPTDPATLPPSGSSSPASSTSAMPTPSTVTSPSAEGPQKVLKLGDHPILQDPNAGLQNRTCSLPPWQSTQDGAEAFFTAASKCLDAAWGPFLEAYHLPFTSPELHFPTGASFDTECGTIQVGIATAAYYCENNLYVPFRGLQTDQYGNNPGVYLALFAHEYGHHVQEVAGLMDAAWQKIYEAGQTSPAGLEMSRRKELQAQCFSGMFLGAHVDQGGTIDRDMYNKAWNDQETRGDNTSRSHDHGTNAHYASWWRAGATNNRIADCNTFSAPSSAVS